MRYFLIIIYIFISLHICFSLDLGGAFSIDYYNNPIEDSAPSPIQVRPILFYNLDISIFNLRTGLGIVEGNYEVSSDDLPVFNDMYSGFYTLEFDIFAYPGISFNITESISLGIAAGGGVRLPLLTKVDDDLDDDVNTDDAFDWFYSDLNFLFWGVQLYTKIKLPLSETTRFFGAIYYKDFITRDDQWIIGATTGMLWQF
ncbi:MAG: hypothetical protein OCD02_19300 [Spirochaetaceae bacterium]